MVVQEVQVEEVEWWRITIQLQLEIQEAQEIHRQVLHKVMLEEMEQELLIIPTIGLVAEEVEQEELVLQMVVPGDGGSRSRRSRFTPTLIGQVVQCQDFRAGGGGGGASTVILELLEEVHQVEVWRRWSWTEECSTTYWNSRMYS
jgi:hypothetical protein